ncbi:MAG: cytochrome b N-terminal domain-containing protein [Pirellulales bacterium]|nr:cytochrome b N-terminal domain-containing protein [Pirellulales bacterium]
MLDRLRNTQFWKSVFRHDPPVDRRNRVLAVLSNVVLHLHPVSIPKHALRLRFTWCMGGITAFLFLVEVVTGAMLMFYYRPTIEFAYRDMLDLRDVVSLGVVREIHRWAAHAMVIAVMLHTLRVFLTGSYKPPREFNWAIGVMLLVLTLFLSFTGYLLPWDQLSLWAVTVGANMAGNAPLVGADIRYILIGASSVGEETLNRFYVLHCIALPLVAIFLMSLHFWRIRKDGGISGPL